MKKLAVALMLTFVAIACGGGKSLVGPSATTTQEGQTATPNTVTASAYDVLLKQKSTFSVEGNTILWHAKNPTNDNVGPFFLLVFDRTLSPQKFLTAAGPFVLEGGTSRDFEVAFEGCGIPLQVDAYLGRELTQEMKNDQFSGGYLLDADWLESAPCEKKIPPPPGCEVTSEGVTTRPDPCPSPSPSPSPTPPPCVDEVTFTYTDGLVTINGITNTGIYYVKDNGNVINVLGTAYALLFKNQTYTFPYAENGHTLKLYDIQNDLQGETTIVATCSDFNSSWHANMSYSCTRVEHHSCPQ